MPDHFVPAVPSDWAEKEAQGTPYVLSVADGEAAWRPVIVLNPVTDANGHLVTAHNRPVYTD